jgi:small subunit ribosomal protein S19e
MVTIHDVPADKLIDELARHIKEKMSDIQPPSWIMFVKSGAHSERVPVQRDFWYIRAASLLRKIYIKGPIGVMRLRSEYGGRKKGKWRRPEHHLKSGGSIIRMILQQLEGAGLVEVCGKEGRVLTPKGRSLLDKIAAKVNKELEVTEPELKKYG